MTCRADLHVHSRFSNRPSEWILRRAGAAESYTEPRLVYELCRRRGMQYVTLTDHDTLDGALEIAELPGTFLSVEVTAAFPEDGCQVHVLVYGLAENEFAEIERLRRNLYELRNYLLDRDLVHSLAHPLFRVDGRMGVDHFERLLLLFKRFEGLNGSRDPRAGIVARAILDNLTPTIVDDLRERHGIDPRDPEPWRKHLTAGSDDHAGLYVANAYTETPAAGTVAEFLEHLRRGEQRIAGETGSSLKLGRSFFALSQCYWEENWKAGGRGGDLLGALLSRLVEGDAPGPKDTLRLVVSNVVRRGDETLPPILAGVLGRMAKHREDYGREAHRRTFRLAARLGQDLVVAAARRVVEDVRGGSMTTIPQHLAEGAAGLLTLAPHLAAFYSQHQDERFVREVAGHFPASRLLRQRTGRRLWISDARAPGAADDRLHRGIVGVLGAGRGDLARLVVGDPGRSSSPAEVVVPSLGALDLADEGAGALSIPAFLDLLERVEREGFDELVVSTPGPAGLLGWAAARLLGLRLTALWQVDLERAASAATGSAALGRLAGSYQRWLLQQADTVWVPEEGAPEVRAGWRTLPAAVDPGVFQLRRKPLRFWSRLGLDEGGPTLLWVGPLDRPGDAELLLEADATLRRQGSPHRLVLVGDGASRATLESRFGGPAVRFAGAVGEQSLAFSYAAADAAVLLDRGDGFGLRVAEALACGCPVLTAEGTGGVGRVRRFDAGLVASRETDSLARGLRCLLVEATRRAALARNARLAAAEIPSWSDVVPALLRADEAVPADPGLAAEIEPVARHTKRAG